MPLLLMRHKVKDFETWSHWFIAEAGIRYGHGARHESFFRNVNDPGEVWMLLEWDDLFRARLFALSDDLLESMERAGVLEQPDFWILEGGDTI